MGDVRFRRVLQRVRDKADRAAALRESSTEDLIMALAAAPPDREPLLANVIATELLNRARRTGAIAEHLVEGVVIADAEGTITYLNPSAARLVGRDADELVGQRMDAVPVRTLEDASVPWEERPTRRALLEGRVIPSKLWLDRPDGTRIPIAATTAPIRAEGVVLGAVISFRDITEERRAADEARFHKTLLDAVGDAVMATRPDGTITYWNRAAERLYGWRAHEVLGRNVVDVTPTLASREAADALMARLRRGESWSGEFQVRRRDGSSFTAHVTNAPVLGERGELLAIVGVSRALHERPQQHA